MNNDNLSHSFQRVTWRDRESDTHTKTLYTLQYFSIKIWNLKFQNILIAKKAREIPILKEREREKLNSEKIEISVYIYIYIYTHTHILFWFLTTIVLKREKS